MKTITNLMLAVLIATTTFATAQVGINTTTPQEDLHVVGDIQITNKIRLGGDASTTGGNLGTDGQILTSGGPTSRAKWSNTSSLKGALTNVYNLIGTGDSQVVSKDQTVAVNGLSQSITVPAGEARVLVITVTGYAAQSDSFYMASQGAFGILVDGTKISSGYVSAQNSNTSGNANTTPLVLLPTPVTFTKTADLGTGTHTITVNFKAWSTPQKININAYTAGYVGADSGDTEALRSRLTILEYTK